MSTAVAGTRRVRLSPWPAALVLLGAVGSDATTYRSRASSPRVLAGARPRISTTTSTRTSPARAAVARVARAAVMRARRRPSAARARAAAKARARARPSASLPPPVASTMTSTPTLLRRRRPPRSEPQGSLKGLPATWPKHRRAHAPLALRSRPLASWATPAARSQPDARHNHVLYHAYVPVHASVVLIHGVGRVWDNLQDAEGMRAALRSAYVGSRVPSYNITFPIYMHPALPLSQPLGLAPICIS